MDKSRKKYLDGNANELRPFKRDKTDTREDNQLLSIFPEEVWHVIVDKIINPVDLENLSNASPFFRDILISNATMFLFPSVFKIMASKWTGISNKEFRALAGTFRLVCPSWNQNIQDFYEFQNGQDQKYAPRTMENTTFPLPNSPGINAFIDHFDKTHYSINPPYKNPFLGRKVTFDDTKFQPGVNTEQPGYLARFWNDISNLLTKYGSHIWHCTLHLEDKFPSREEYFFRLSGWLDLMPNLRSLRVIYYNNLRNKTYSRAHLEQVISDHCLAKLKHLECLETRNLPVPISDELVRRNSQIKRLVVNGEAYAGSET